MPRLMLKRLHSTRQKLPVRLRDKNCGMNSRPLLDTTMMHAMMTANLSSMSISSNGDKKSMRSALKTSKELPAVKPRRSRRKKRPPELEETLTTTKL